MSLNELSENGFEGKMRTAVIEKVMNKEKQSWEDLRH